MKSKPTRTLTAILISLICVLLLAVTGVFCGENAAYAAGESNFKLTETVLGIGGGGAVFTPKISPFNANDMAVSVDMGGVYISRNAGSEWRRKNLNGQVLTAYYDPTQENVVYAGGSGLYKSVDGGDNFELFFPNKDDLTASLNNAENNLRYLYTRSGIYPTEKAVKDVLVNPNDRDNVFILMFSASSAGLDGAIFETADGGVTFEKIISYTLAKRFNSNILFELNKLLYQKESNTLYFATGEGVYKYDSAAKTAGKVYSSQKGIVDIVTVFEDGATRFIAVENGSATEGCKTRVFVTDNFTDIDDITQKITAGLPRTITNGDKQTSYNWSFSYLDATSTENIYLSQASYAEDTSIYVYGIEGILHYDGNGGEWLYGNNPAIDNNAKNQMSLKNRGWSDGNYKSYGIAVSKQQGYENTILYTTITGVYYSPDGTDFYQRYCDVTKDGNTVCYSTTGLNEQTTYGIVTDPFNKDNVFILNTDLGLIRSEDGGRSWQRAIGGVPFGGSLNSYDMVFDPRFAGVAYSLWSNRHDVPYSPANEAGKAGAFLYSSDGGKSWNDGYSSGIPADATPVKMSVIFPNDKNADAVIYVATFNKGFFVSYNSGKTFTELNDGIAPVEYNSANSFILGCDIEAKDGRVFAMTAKSTYGGGVQSGEVFELIDGVWQKIALPDGADNPRDIYYSGGTLYISCTTNRKNFTASGFTNFAGGVYACKDGQTDLIFDDSISATGVQIDSKGTLFISDINGNIYRKEAGGEYEKIYDNFHTLSKGLQLTDDDELYLPTLGGGLLKLKGLSGLYSRSAAKNKGGNLALCIGLPVAAVAVAAIITVVLIRLRPRRQKR
ncbi:MAG: hypothetical protein NC033_00530 [Clostridiales bacterium]|nr:hypothetical protein [Clostridiales bacterium]